MITKTDFMEFLDTPMHMWAEKHDRAAPAPTAFDRHLMEQGKAIEKLAKGYLPVYLGAQGAGQELSFEKTFTDGQFQTRVDALVHDHDQGAYDLYEIKSSTHIDKQHKQDLAFQRLVCEASIPVRHVFLVHVNRDYIRDGDLDLAKLLIVEDVTDETEAFRAEVAAARDEAAVVATRVSPEGIAGCLKPRTCPCLDLCHPALPEYPIYDLPRLHKKKARNLKAQGILAIEDIPDDFPLSDRQRLQVAAVKQGAAGMNAAVIQGDLAQLEYPLYFLDYESYNPAVPQYDGYRPYQHMVFQYSLHVIAEPGGEPAHSACLVTTPGDPAGPLLEQLARDLGSSGSVIVWNQGFEGARNREMAEQHPQYRDLLAGINARIYDLMKPFSKGHYVHPDFHGSASIKKVLPVLVDEQELSYDELPIPQGDEAMLAWARVMAHEPAPGELEQTREALLRYCELDTLAMVRNWQALVRLVDRER